MKGTYETKMPGFDLLLKSITISEVSNTPL